MPSVRGIGVAVSVSTSTSARSALIASFWRTPKRCSSSMISRPRRVNLTSLLSSLWVPTTMSIVPSAMPSIAALISLVRAEARQLGHLDRPVAEAVGDGLVVLLGQQRGRRQDRHLLAAHHRDEGGAQRDLGLAEADVAADQPVHRLGADHVLDHGVDRRALVGRLLEAEAGGKRLVVVRGIAERVALARSAARVQVQQFGGGVAHLLGGLALLALSHWPEPSLCSGASSGETPV